MAPWWAYLIPVGVDLIKGLISGGADKTKQVAASAVNEAKLRHRASQTDRMRETNVANTDDIANSEGD